MRPQVGLHARGPPNASRSMETPNTLPTARRLFEEEPADPITAVKEMLRQAPPGISHVENAGAWLGDLDRLLDSARDHAAGKKKRTQRGSRARRSRTRAQETSHNQNDDTSYSVTTLCGAGSMDLRESLNQRRREREDRRVTIKRSCEGTYVSRGRAPEHSSRRLRREHNAERSSGKRHQYSSSSESKSAPERHPKRKKRTENHSFTGGCAALSTRLCRVQWAHKFRPDLPKRYDGTAPPGEFLEIYSMAVKTAGGSEDVMASYFHIALKDSARSWIMNLAP